MANKRFKDFPMVWEALENLGIDNGGSPRDVKVPVEWLDRVRLAENELCQMTPEERGDFVFESIDLVPELKARAPWASELLDACFEGDLSEIVMRGHESAVEHVAYENEIARKRRSP